MPQPSRIASAAARSPWFWPIIPLFTVAAVGQWGSALAAEAVASFFCVLGVGIAIGLAVGGGRASSRPEPVTQSAEHTPKAQPPREPTPVTSAGADAKAPMLNLSPAADLRRARLANTMLVRADLREADLRDAILAGADLRGAILAGADLSGADLTDARLGPVEDGPPLESA